jgi:CHASE3 domain sensor protein
VLEGKRRRSFGGAELRGHDERSAKKLLADALRELGSDRKAVRAMKQNAPVKQSLVWLMKTRTTMSNDWIGKELSVGNRRNITRAVAAVRQGGTREMHRLRKQLEKMSQRPD